MKEDPEEGLNSSAEKSVGLILPTGRMTRL